VCVCVCVFYFLFYFALSSLKLQLHHRYNASANLPKGVEGVLWAWRKLLCCCVGSSDGCLLGPDHALGVRRSEAVQGQHRLGSEGVRMVLA
jgi:hypothetical protein